MTSSNTNSAQLNKEVIPLSTAIHFPTKLTKINFPVWKKQIESTLFGYNLLCYLTGELQEPAKILPEKTTINPDHLYGEGKINLF